MGRVRHKRDMPENGNLSGVRNWPRLLCVALFFEAFHHSATRLTCRFYVAATLLGFRLKGELNKCPSVNVLQYQNFSPALCLKPIQTAVNLPGTNSIIAIRLIFAFHSQDKKFAGTIQVSAVIT